MLLKNGGDVNSEVVVDRMQTIMMDIRFNCVSGKCDLDHSLDRRAYIPHTGDDTNGDSDRDGDASSGDTRAKNADNTIDLHPRYTPISLMKVLALNTFVRMLVGGADAYLVPQQQQQSQQRTQQQQEHKQQQPTTTAASSTSTATTTSTPTAASETCSS